MRKHLLVSLFVFGLSTLALYADVMVPFGPDLGGGIPAYAPLIQRLANGDVVVPNDGVWAAITFYRDPACVPPDFDLLNLFDPQALRCTLTVEGFEIWCNGPGTGDLGPIQSVSHGLGAVPIWFVKLSDLEAAISDGNLTVGELEGLSTLKKGTATFFKATQHPLDVANVTHIEISARGVLQDGGQFQYQLTGGQPALIGHVRIVFW